MPPKKPPVEKAEKPDSELTITERALKYGVPEELIEFVEGPPISQRIKEAYEKGDADGYARGEKAGFEKGHSTGYAEGYEAAFPKPNLFEACRRDALRLPPKSLSFSDAEALGAISNIMEKRMSEYGEKMPKSDRDLLFYAWARQSAVRQDLAAAPPSVTGVRSNQPPDGEPQFEYEVVS